MDKYTTLISGKHMNKAKTALAEGVWVFKRKNINNYSQSKNDVFENMGHKQGNIIELFTDL